MATMTDTDTFWGKKKRINMLVHALFNDFDIKDTCTWYGTTYEGTGKNAKLLPCGEPTVGAGLFCDPYHTICEYHSLCERHARNGKTEKW